MNVLIVGGGRIGSYLTGLLLEGGHEVQLIELDEAVVERLERNIPTESIVQGSGTDADLLERVGIHRADVVVAVTNRDETNLVVTSLAKYEFHVPRVIGRVTNPKNAWLYTAEMGVDVAFNQADIISHLVAEEMSMGEMMILLKLRRGQFALLEEQVAPGAPAAGRRVDELSLGPDCLLVGVIRGSQLIVPHGDTRLEPGDEVLAVVRSGREQVLAGVLGEA